MAWVVRLRRVPSIILEDADLLRAYAEGRANGTNTHATNSEAWKAHAWGVNNRANSAYAYETAVP